MPSFVCDHCQETLKKAKLDQHAQRCRQAAFSCIDCYTTFKGVEYRTHTSCITEAQKHHTAKTKEGKLPVKNHHGAPAAPPAPAAVETPQKEEPALKRQKAEETAKPGSAKTEAAEAPTEREMIVAKLTKAPQTLKGLLKAVKKGDETKKQKKAAKKWLMKHCQVSIDSKGAVLFKLD